MKRKRERIQIDSWKGLVALEHRFDRSGQEWVFRGQCSPKYRMRSTLERACADFRARGGTIREVEKRTLEDFKRSCHLYSASRLPDDSDTLGWMALMRHYGAPSRLVDFSYSFFIATYFAAEAEKAKPVIWAVNKTWLSRHMESQIRAIPSGADGVSGEQLWEGWFRREGWVVDRLLIKRKPALSFVAPSGPMKFNDRLFLQQGLFLASSDVTVPFHDALEQLPRNHQRTVIEIRIAGAKARFEILNKLHRCGLSRVALFPGLQGYAESLRPKILTVLKLESLKRAGARVGPRFIGE